VYDLSHESWLPHERREYHEFLNKSRDLNINEETSPFHDGWYGYKHFGIGLGCYATMGENPRAEELLRAIEKDYIERAVPCLKVAGDGGGWAEGYYTNYWVYFWLIFCEAARTCEGVDYYKLAPEFYQNRAVTSMFELSPGVQERFTHRSIPMGDGNGGRLCKRERDWALAARAILSNYYRTDPAHQAVKEYDAATPQFAFQDNAYLDFLWRDDATEATGALAAFKLSHFSPGPGNVYARSSWMNDASYLYFHCGKRFTAHQHLDQGHLLIQSSDELLSDGGHYEWCSNHGINYFMRSIAHNTMLIYDPAEKFPAYMRAGGDGLNDGGQRYPWVGTIFRHNGCPDNYDEWAAHPELHDTGTMLAFQDEGSFVYTAGDVTKAYAAQKLDTFTRQIVFVRPGTFIIFDRVRSKNATCKKTCLWQAAKLPVGGDGNYVINNGPAKLFMQILLPARPEVVMNHGPHLYEYHGHNVWPDGCEMRNRPEPECRMEVSPTVPSEIDYFLHVLTVTDGLTGAVPQGAVQCNALEVTVRVEAIAVTFQKNQVGGHICIGEGSTAMRTELRHLSDRETV